MVRRHEFKRNESAPSGARSALAELDPPLDGTRWEDATLLVSELVTNSVLHGEGSRVLLLIDDARPERFRCEVVDEGQGFVPQERGDREIGGWGLQLVERLTSRWGVSDGSTHVWFELCAESSDN